MKFGQPILSSQLSGALAGVVGSSARGGVNYFRVRAIPANPRSQAQSTMRLILTSVAAAWAGILTDLQRGGWAGLASGSESGIDAYAKVNTQVLLAQEDRVDDPPDTIALSTEPEVIPTVDASSHTITFGAVAGAAADVALNVFISKPQKSSRLSQEFGFTFVGTVPDVVAGGAATLSLTHPAYNLVAGDIVYVRCVQVGTTGGANEGKVSVEQIFRCVVVA